MINYSLKNWKSIFGHFAPKFIKITFMKEIQTLIVEYIVSHAMLTRCQKKRYEQGCDILTLFVLK